MRNLQTTGNLALQVHNDTIQYAFRAHLATCEHIQRDLTRYAVAVGCCVTGIKQAHPSESGRSVFLIEIKDFFMGVHYFHTGFTASPLHDFQRPETSSLILISSRTFMRKETPDVSMHKLSCVKRDRSCRSQRCGTRSQLPGRLPPDYAKGIASLVACNCQHNFLEVQQVKN
jgi:hypothetical protein